jgi:methylmalonyl-CoA/ethylmalonyl-CoA epimerase
MSIKRIDHIAIAVSNVEEAAAFYRDALGLEVQHIEEVGGQAVKVAFLPVGGSEIELVEPTSEDSGTAKFLSQHGPGMHHLCLEVDDLDATLARLKAQGVQLINEEPVPGAGGKRIAFIHPRSTSGVLIELTETIST